MTKTREADSLQELDEALLAVRRLWLHPERRRRLLARIGVAVELATIRTLYVIGAAGPSSPSVAEVAAALGVDPSTASRLVNQAAQEGYVTRQKDPADKRRSTLSLTEEGRALVDRARSARQALLADATAGWSGRDVGRLAELLFRLRRDMDEELS